MRNVLDFGAVGDGIANNTKAIQRALDAGGTVYFPDGIYLTGTIYLRSNGGLELAPNATLLASPNPADYNSKGVIPQEANSGVGGGSGAHLIIALEAENVCLHGGKYDGNGRSFYQGCKTHERFTGGTQMETPPWRPQQLLFFCECRNVCLDNFTIQDSAVWACFLYGCEDVSVHRINIFNSPLFPEDDGLDIDCCRRVTVSDCNIQAGDDALTLRACPATLKNPGPCEWVSVTNCLLQSAYAHAIRVGVGSGIIRHCAISNTMIRDSHCAVHINSKYSDKSTNGVAIHDLTFRNLDVDVEMLTSICLDYKFVKENPSTQSIDHITFSQITGQISLPSRIIGNGVGHISNIRFSDVCLRTRGACLPSKRTKTFLMLIRTDAAFLLKQTEAIRFDRVQLDYSRTPEWTTGLQEELCSGTSIHDSIHL